jgi:hypothetical protein
MKLHTYADLADALAAARRAFDIKAKIDILYGAVTRLIDLGWQQGTGLVRGRSSPQGARRGGGTMSQPKPRPTIAVISDGVVRSFGRLSCSCGRVLQAYDIYADRRDGGVSIVCAGCHGDLFTIEWTR